MTALQAAIAEDESDGVVPVAVVGTAGTTDTGAIDLLGDLAEMAGEYGTWFHVDGADGLIAAASPALRPAFAAVADADSVIVDPHKRPPGDPALFYQSPHPAGRRGRAR